MYAELTKNPRSFFHPFLFAIYPIFALLAFNIKETPFSLALRSFGLSLVVTIFLLVLFSRIAGNSKSGAILTTLFWVLFFSYGHIHSFIELPISLFGTNLRSHRYMIPFFLFMFLLAAWILRKRPRLGGEVSGVLNLLGAFLLILPVLQIGNHYVQLYSHSRQVESNIAGMEQAAGVRPDVYLIVLDMYTRDDFMQDHLGFDNSAFIEGLTRRGFFVAQCSLSNYSTTKLSLTSSLNMDYLDVLFPIIGPSYKNETILDVPLKHSRVRAFFEEQGYSIVAFQNDYPFTEWTDADYYFDVEETLSKAEELTELLPEGERDQLSLNNRSNPLSDLMLGLNLNPFEWLLVQTTAARVVPDYITRTTTAAEITDHYLKSIRKYFLVKLTLEQAHQAVQIEGPKFVYLHLVDPHPPFSVDENGSFEPMKNSYSNREWYREYAQQVQSINAEILSLLDTILANPETAPIIVLQGDHGIPWFDWPGYVSSKWYQRNEILNAYFLPQGEEFLYPTISPVNTWRLILNQNFNMNFELLPDLAYTYDWKTSIFDHEPYPEQSPRCQ